jgi:hypothetical protein
VFAGTVTVTVYSRQFTPAQAVKVDLPVLVRGGQPHRGDGPEDLPLDLEGEVLARVQHQVATWNGSDGGSMTATLGDVTLDRPGMFGSN